MLSLPPAASWSIYCVARFPKPKRNIRTLSSQADYTLDFRGSISSITLLKITRLFNEMKALEIMELLGLDADTIQDLFKVLADSSYEIIDTDLLEEKGDFHRLRLRKRH
jgi:TusA-related sulfurtransferase